VMYATTQSAGSATNAYDYDQHNAGWNPRR